MLKQRQRWRLHRPDVGRYADCARTAVACLLDMPRNDVPHFQRGIKAWDGETMLEVLSRARTWLLTKGLTVFYVETEAGNVLEALGTFGGWNSGHRYLFCGGTRHEGVNHIACALGSKVEWVTCKDADIVSGYWPRKRVYGAAIIGKDLR